MKPGQGRRPSNRRELILGAAAELFAQHGYGNVSMNDIAAAVSVQPSALYRHVRSKQDLLLATIRAEIAPFSTAACGRDKQPRVELINDLVANALTHRTLGVLWSREARNLPPSDRLILRDDYRTVTSLLENALGDWRSGLTTDDCRLLIAATLATLHSLSYHRADLSDKNEFAAILTDIVSSVLDTTVPHTGRGTTARYGSATRHELAADRREVILAAASRLFADRGYSAVGLDDIGAAAGMAGPSVYYHFDEKRAILAILVSRGTCWLRADLDAAVGRVVDPADRARAMIWIYIDSAFIRHELITIMLNDTDHLDDEPKNRARNEQRRTVDQLAALTVQATHTGSKAAARIRVIAALTIVNDLARTERFRKSAHTRALIQAACMAVLGLA